MATPHTEVDRWVQRLQATAATAEKNIPPGLAPWFQFARGAREEPTSAPTGQDESLWGALAAGEALPTPPPTEPRTELMRSLFPLTAETALEVWTERDLSALHAVSRLLERRDDPVWRRRLDGAVRWHLENTQPDNATGRPWAIHLFIRRWLDHDDAAARLYAETLLQNCQMLAARPDPLSAEILRDAADALSPHPDHR